MCIRDRVTTMQTFTKLCPKCNLTKSSEDFGKSSNYSSGLRSWCADCEALYKATDPRGIASGMLTRAKRRAKDKKLGEVTLTRDWIVEKLEYGLCEATGLQFRFNNSKSSRTPGDYAPSIDRIDNSKGYTQNNCQVVIWAYNGVKNNFNKELIKLIASKL